MALILSGTELAKVSEEILRQKIEKLGTGIAKPALSIIQIGDDNRSNIYIGRKIAYGRKVGIEVEYLKLSESITEEDLKEKIEELNNKEQVSGIIVQMPLPPHLSAPRIFSFIDKRKDVDGLSPGSTHMPATARGILKLLDNYDIDVSGKKVVVIGRSRLVGQPTALALLQRNATVTICHKGTPDIKEFTKLADIIIVAAGSAGLITAEHVKPGQVVIDVGINRYMGDEIGKKIVGDVSYNEVEFIVSAISPVPGGVGPLTVASLFENVWEAYYNK